MADRTVEASPQVYARVGGVLYLYIIVVGGLGEFYRGSLIVSGDPTATANRIIASQLLWRLSIAGELLHLVFAVALAMIFYVLLGPVSKNLALLAAFLNLVSIAIEATVRVSLFAVLFPLGDAGYLKTFEPGQLHVLAYLALRVYDYGFAASLVFFGCCLFFYGFLIFKSGFFPKFLGVLVAIGSLCYVINSFVDFVAPRFANIIFPAILLPGFIAELSLSLWLVVKGVNLAKWQEQATMGPTSGALN